MMIKMSVALESIVELNERDQYIVSRVVMVMSWKDRYLKWNPDKYNQVDQISMPPSDIWRPDIVVLNVLDDSSYQTNLDESHNRVLVDSNGTVHWRVRKTMRTSCPINVAKFPF